MFSARGVVGGAFVVGGLRGEQTVRGEQALRGDGVFGLAECGEHGVAAGGGQLVVLVARDTNLRGAATYVEDRQRGQRRAERPEHTRCRDGERLDTRRDGEVAGQFTGQCGQFMLGRGAGLRDRPNLRAGVAEHGLRAVDVDPRGDPAVVGLAGKVIGFGKSLDGLVQLRGFGVEPAQPRIGVGHGGLQAEVCRGEIGLAGFGFGAS